MTIYLPSKSVEKKSSITEMKSCSHLHLITSVEGFNKHLPQMHLNHMRMASMLLHLCKINNVKS